MSPEQILGSGKLWKTLLHLFTVLLQLVQHYKEPQESVALSDNTNSVPLKHQNKQSHLDTNGTLSHLHVSNSLGDVVPFRLSSGDQIALSKLHRLPKSGAPQGWCKSFLS